MRFVTSESVRQNKNSGFAKFVGVGLTVLALLALGVPAAAQAPPSLPAPAPGGPANVFYGAIPTNGEMAPVLVFIHGFRGIASDWWIYNDGTENDMYRLAYRAGYRTAFLSMNADNTRNDETFQHNAEVLKVLLPQVAAHYNVSRFYAVTHSKGGVDLQAAMLDPSVSSLINAVFSIACPCNGSALADWAVGPGKAIADALGISGPSLSSLTTANVGALRAQADPLFSIMGIPFYTIAGVKYTGNVLTAVTGLLLQNLTGELNDGFVTLSETKLPAAYAVDLGNVYEHHFKNNKGSVVLPKIGHQLQGLELTLKEFRKVASDGFGDPGNSWAWSMKWFKGKLYVGTGRLIQCQSLLTSDIKTGTTVYPLTVAAGVCPPGEDLLEKLSAEIWEYTPERKSWRRAFKSELSIPVVNANSVVGYTARDVGFRGMTVVHEQDGTEALYVGGVTSGSIYDAFPPYNTGTPYPPPRILRTTDGVTWTPLPQAPGTFLGDLGEGLPGSSRKITTVRGMEQLGDKLFASVGDFRGVGSIIVSSNPAAGNDAWQAASPIPEEFPVWNIQRFNGCIYVTTGDEQLATNTGYGVYKTDGSAPFTYIPVVTDGGFAPPPFRAQNGLSFGILNNRLYLGTNRLTELIRINPGSSCTSNDDTWDLVVGEPRDTPQGFKAPISGLGSGFSNNFTGHMWRMGSLNDNLYLTTWDWSVGMRFIILLDSVFRAQYGFDAYRTQDGVYWNAITRSGMNDFNSGGRSIEGTPFGIFIGSASPSSGLQVYQDTTYNDLNKDGVIDQKDVMAIMAARNAPASGPEDPRDLDRDGVITALDARKLITQCADPRCTVKPLDPTVRPPTKLEAVSEQISGRQVMLSWEPSPDAVRYRVYRMEVRGILQFLPPGLTITLPGVPDPIKIPEDILAGKLDALCTQDPEGIPCLLIKIVKGIDNLTQQGIGFPMPVVPVPSGITANTFFEEQAPTPMQSIYFVRAEDASGRLSESSNIVGGPSKAAPPSFQSLQSNIQSMATKGLLDQGLAGQLVETVRTADSTAGDSVDDALSALSHAETALEQRRGANGVSKEAFSDLRLQIRMLSRSLRLAKAGVFPAERLRGTRIAVK